MRPHEFETLDARDEIAIQDCCDRFQAAIQRGEEPKLDIWLDEAPKKHRPELRSKLIHLVNALQKRKDAQANESTLDREDWATVEPQLRPFSTISFSATTDHGLPETGTTGNTVRCYKLQELLGRGAFGAVYRGHRVDEPDRQLAIKVATEADQRDVSLLEPTLLARLEHSNIVRLYDYFVEKSQLFLVLEFIQGGSLADYVQQKGALTSTEIAELLHQIASALAHVHERGVTHRDLKPQNILVDDTGDKSRFVLADFGIGRTAAGIQMHAERAGTLSYMAPEQFRGRAVPQSDLWALGVIGYQLLSGKLPFPATSLPELVEQLYFATPAALDGRGDPLRDDLCRIVHNLLERSLSARTESAADVLRELALALATSSEDVSPGQSPSRPRFISGWQESLLRTRRWSIAIFVTLLMLTALVGGILETGLTLLGCGLFWQSQRKATTSYAVCAVGLLVLCAMAVLNWFQFLQPLSPISFWIERYLLGHEWLRDDSQPGSTQDLNRMLAIGNVAATLELIVTWLCAIAAAYQLTRIRSLTRQLALERDLRAPTLAPEERLNRLRSHAEVNPTDLRVRLEYADSLFAKQDYENALVEALLILDADPYHFNANLLVAEGYLRLGLNTHCIDHCEYYLRAVPYAFEFRLLLGEARKRGRLQP